MENFNMGRVNALIKLERKGIALTHKEKSYLDAYRLMLEEKSKPVIRRPAPRRDELMPKRSKRAILEEAEKNTVDVKDDGKTIEDSSKEVAEEKE